MAQAKLPSLELDGALATERLPEDRLLVGHVIEVNAAGATVRWQTADGVLQQEPLAIVQGLTPRPGDLVILQRPANWPAWLVTQVVESVAAAAPREVKLNATPEIAVDGKRVQIEGSDEIVLRCGKASITLRSNGRLVIRGAYVETRAGGVNRIKGGSVLIN